VYHGSQYLHKTTDNGKTWEIISPDLTAFDPKRQVAAGRPITRDVTGEEYFSTIYEIQESKLQEGLIWVGANDGPIHVTRDGGKTWKNVTPKMPLDGRVDSVEPSPHNPAKAYVTVLRYQLNDYKPYIFKTEDYGATWELITNGIPNDYPVRVVREDPTKEGLLFAGTEFGLFTSFDDGKNWQSFQNNLPVTPITDLKIYDNDIAMSTMGRGFWILDNISSMYSMDAALSSDVYLFKPEDTFRFRYRGGSGTPEFPNPAVTIDYYLKDKDQAVELEIVNEEGRVVKSFTSGKPVPVENLEVDMATGFSTPPPSSGLENESGLNRFSWNMRNAGGWDSNPKRAYQGFGPMVSTGNYSVRLKVDGKVLTEQFNLALDPRATLVTDADVKEQEKVGLQVQSFQEEVERLLVSVSEMKKALENSLQTEKVSKNNQKKKAELEALYYRIVTPPGTYMQGMLQSQLGYLGSMLGRADQAPGQDVYERLEELKAEYQSINSSFQKLK
jgi:hypothetical protein